MFFKQRADVMYRNYGSFGYMTDNRNFRYKFDSDDEQNIGDIIVSESGAIFLSVLTRKPQSIDELVDKICEKIIDINRNVIKRDALEFYFELEEKGFIASGKTSEECDKKNYDLTNKNIMYRTQKEKNETHDFIDKYFNGEPQLTSLHIEIISKCNERCIHCYIPHEKKTGIMTADMFYDILKQGREMNLLHVTISGGEPMAHGDFLSFLQCCNRYNLSVNILSNLTLINEDIIEEMRQNALLCVQTSLYSMDADIHDAITQEKGSFEKTKLAILELIRNNIPVQISCPILKQNMDSYKSVFEWGKKYNINVNCDYVIIAGYDHTIQNLNCRLGISDVRKIINDEIDNGLQYLESMKKEVSNRKDRDLDDNICSVCQSSLCISENGDVFPCAGWQDYVIGNVKKSKLKDVWDDSAKIKYLRNLRRRDFPECIQCPDKDFCTMCMVRNSNEDPHGNPLKVNRFFCDVARVNKELFLERYKSEIK